MATQRRMDLDLSSVPSQGSFAAAAGELLACHEGPEDLSSNASYLEGFGTSPIQPSCPTLSLNRRTSAVDPNT